MVLQSREFHLSRTACDRGGALYDLYRTFSHPFIIIIPPGRVGEKPFMEEESCTSILRRIVLAFDNVLAVLV
jgi:hypothetical protein